MLSLIGRNSISPYTAAEDARTTLLTLFLAAVSSLTNLKKFSSVVRTGHSTEKGTLGSAAR
jgi:hypothetical protein